MDCKNEQLTYFFHYIGPGLVSHWLSCFKVFHYYHLLLCRVNTWSAASLLKKRLQRRCFPVNIEKFLRTIFYRTHSQLHLKRGISTERFVYITPSVVVYLSFLWIIFCYFSGFRFWLWTCICLVGNL